MTNRFEGGDLLVQSLMNLGVRQIFSVSGGPLNSIYHACAQHGLPLVHNRHEAAAGFMADAVARLTGVPGVAAVTLGPGVTNMTTPALVALMAGTPMLIIGAQAPIASFDKGVAMSADHMPIMKPVTKWSARVHETKRIPEYVEAAWRHMWAGRPGPVFLEIPVDILAAPAEPARPAGFAVARPGLGEADRTALLSAIAGAKRPLFLLGDQLHWEKPAGLKEAVTRLGAPFATLRLARGIIDEHHPLSVGPGYLPCNQSLRRTLSEADLVLLVGHDFEFDLGFGADIQATARIVQTAADASLLGRGRKADLAILAGTQPVIDALATADGGAIDRAWGAARAAAWRDEHKAQAGEGSPGEPLHPVAAIDAVVAAAPEDAVFVTSHGNVDFWADARLRVRSSDLYLRAGQAGALGAEVCFGLGARMANPARPSIVFVGDGGVGYHLTELDTAARHGAPFVIVVLDDEKWAAIALPQRLDYGGEYAMDLPKRDWAGVARGLGGDGYLARTADEIATALKAALSSDRPSILHVPVRSVLSPYMKAISK
jgi:acetolactate synthase-1/2/3 large subunit